MAEAELHLGERDTVASMSDSENPSISFLGVSSPRFDIETTNMGSPARHGAVLRRPVKRLK